MKQKPGSERNLLKNIFKEFFRSIVRHGYPDSDKNRSLVIISNIFLHIFPVKVREHALKIRYTLCMGGVSLFLFLILILTGGLLMLYYVPETNLAYRSIKNLEFSVSSGRLLRNMHRLASHGIIITVFLHMCRVFFTGSYKAPREFNWVIGVCLFIITLALSFTGYLLPWDQQAYWSVSIFTTISSYIPFGIFPRHIFLGGNSMGQETLIRFFTFHVFFLPLICGVLIGIHIWRIRKDGGISGPAL